VWIKQGDADFSSPKTVFVSMLSYFSWTQSTGMVVFNAGNNVVEGVNKVVSKNQSIQDFIDGRN
jgi:hypothetical protein